MSDTTLTANCIKAPSNIRCYRTPEAAAYCSLSKSTFDKLRLTGGGPTYFKIGRTVAYDIQDLDQWLDGKRRLSTSDVT